jgi:hypothetical protein
LILCIKLQKPLKPRSKDSWSFGTIHRCKVICCAMIQSLIIDFNWNYIRSILNIIKYSFIMHFHILVLVHGIHHVKVIVHWVGVLVLLRLLIFLEFKGWSCFQKIFDRFGIKALHELWRLSLPQFSWKNVCINDMCILWCICICIEYRVFYIHIWYSNLFLKCYN